MSMVVAILARRRICMTTPRMDIGIQWHCLDLTWANSPNLPHTAVAEPCMIKQRPFGPRNCLYPELLFRRPERGGHMSDIAGELARVCEAFDKPTLRLLDRK